MDVFSRTFLPAAAEAGVAIPTVSRHMPVFRRCVEPDDTTVLVSRCYRPDTPLAGEFMLLLTYRSDELHRRHPLRPLLAVSQQEFSQPMARPQLIFLGRFARPHQIPEGLMCGVGHPNSG